MVKSDLNAEGKRNPSSLPLMPFGIRYSKTINLIQAGICAVSTVVFVFVAIPSLMTEAQLEDMAINVPSLLAIVLLVLALGMAPAFLLLKLNKLYAVNPPSARVFQIVANVFFLLWFPLGTILFGISLYHMLFDPKVREALS